MIPQHKYAEDPMEEIMDRMKQLMKKEIVPIILKNLIMKS